MEKGGIFFHGCAVESVYTFWLRVSSIKGYIAYSNYLKRKSWDGVGNHFRLEAS